MEDIWDDCDEQFNDKIATNSWNRLQEMHGVFGYKEGINEGKQTSLQGGFDEGYKESMELSSKLGEVYGKLTMILQLGIVKDDDSIFKVTEFKKRVSEIKVIELKKDLMNAEVMIRNVIEECGQLLCEFGME